MIRIQHFLTAGALAAGLLLAGGPLAGADKPGDQAGTQAKGRRKGDSRRKAGRPRSPSGNSARNWPRSATASARCLAMHQKLPFNTQQNSPTEIMSVCLAFGCNSEVSLEGPEGQRINGITCLCWNYPCNGFEMLGCRRRPPRRADRLRLSGAPGEFLAMLALSPSADYPVRAGRDVRNVADWSRPRSWLAARAATCRSG